MSYDFQTHFYYTILGIFIKNSTIVRFSQISRFGNILGWEPWTIGFVQTSRNANFSKSYVTFYFILNLCIAIICTHELFDTCHSGVYYQLIPLYTHTVTPNLFSHSMSIVESTQEDLPTPAVTNTSQQLDLSKLDYSSLSVSETEQTQSSVIISQVCLNFWKDTHTFPTEICLPFCIRIEILDYGRTFCRNRFSLTNSVRRNILL